MRIAIAGATGLVGRELTTLARAAGHDVVELSRSQGIDLVAGGGIEEALTGVEAVVDVTNAPTTERDGATEFFATVGERLGGAATRAGVARTVVLSIVGVDRTPDDGYFVAKLAHERSTQAHAPGPRVLRAAQFHEFAGQSLEWGRDGDASAISDMTIQPVAMTVVAQALLDMATDADDRAHVEIAGPRRERLVEMVRRLVAERGDDVAVRPGPVSDAVRDGALLPGPAATIAGPDFAAWLAASDARVGAAGSG
ncbi:MAG TPA: hypothetical protein VHZ31_00415 [Solirubrobacteraceae bacterium]|jgi:uncharacterized protein YbjT (DUF2867 family)|nr:hypothetical protein [Solirubrobacteraceae bacterium]